VASLLLNCLTYVWYSGMAVIPPRCLLDALSSYQLLAVLVSQFQFSCSREAIILEFINDIFYSCLPIQFSHFRLYVGQRPICSNRFHSITAIFENLRGWCQSQYALRKFSNTALVNG